MDFACLSSIGYGKITLSVRNVSFFLTKTIMDERLNQQLCESLKIALQNEDVLQNTEGSSRSTPRQATPEEAAEALALMIDQLPEPKRYLRKGKYELNLLYYEEAFKKYTQPDIKKNIHKFQERYQLNIEKIDCKKSNDSQFIREKFINWVMMILKCDYLDIYYKYNPKPQKDNKNDRDDKKLKSQKIKSKKSPTQEISIHQEIGENFTREDTLPCRSLSGLELILEKELKQIARQLKDLIEEDPENRFKNFYPKDRQDCNCQTLVKLKYLKEPPLNTREIKEQLGIPKTTIDSHLERKCIPLLQEIAKELGYE